MQPPVIILIKKYYIKLIITTLFFCFNSTLTIAQNDAYVNSMGMVETVRKTLCLNGLWNTACSSASVDILKCAGEHVGEQAQRICQYELNLSRRAIEYNSEVSAKRAALAGEKERLRRIAAADEETKTKITSQKEHPPAVAIRQPKLAAPAAKVRDYANNDLTPAELQSSMDALHPAFSKADPPIPNFSDAESRLNYQDWFDRVSEKLMEVKPGQISRTELLQTVWYESKRAGLEPSLVLGMIETASNFRKFYIDDQGARGYMGVMPNWVRLSGDGDASKLFHMQINLRFGCVVLRHYLDKREGNLQLALRDYSVNNRLLMDSEHKITSHFATLVLRNELHWR